MITMLSCTHKIGQPEYPPHYSFEKIYSASYLKTWSSLIRLMALYPELKTVDKKKGLIITEWLDEPYNSRLYQHPLKSDGKTLFRSRLIIHVVAGTFENFEKTLKSSESETMTSKEEATKVIVQKELVKENEITNMASDFYDTDGFEEKILLYRLGRVLYLTQEEG